MVRRYIDWWGALTVLAVTGVLVALDLTDRPVHRYWSRHSFTSSVLAGVLVLLLTLLIVDQVARLRQLRNRSRAIAAQAAIIIAQATRATTAVTGASGSEESREEASQELRAYMQMLLVSAPVLIDAELPRTFLETAERLVAVLAHTLRGVREGVGEQGGARASNAMRQLRAAGAPLLQALTEEERVAVSSEELDSQAP